MTENTLETIVGAVVIAASLGFLGFATRDNIKGAAASSYELVANFNQANGIAPGTDVRLSGVKIGAVNAIELNKKTYQAKVKLTVANDVPIPTDSVIKITSDGLLGGSYLAIEPGAEDAVLKAGAEFEYVRGSVDFLTLLSTFATPPATNSPSSSANGSGSSAANRESGPIP